MSLARYVHKNVDHAIEDAGFPNSQGSEFYIIGNPGEGLYAEQAANFGVLAPKPQRRYDALELRFDRRFAKNYYFNLNYTYSRLYGNYSGLSSSDEEGRLSPNVNRYFDQPPAGFTVAGGPDNGLLPTDRPHVLKFYGGYRFNWSRLGFNNSNDTDLLLFTTAQSGTVLTTFVAISNIDFIPLTRRGDMGRTPTFTQTDFAIRHRIKFGRDDRYQFVFDLDAINVFNQHIVTNRVNDISITDFAADDPAYGLITPAEKTACGSNRQCSLIIAYRRFQLNGACDRDGSCQWKRTIRTVRLAGVIPDQASDPLRCTLCVLKPSTKTAIKSHPSDRMAFSCSTEYLLYVFDLDSYFAIRSLMPAASGASGFALR